MFLDDVVKNIGIISRNHGVLAGMQASGDDARELRTLLQDTGALARETSERLMSLQRGQHASGMPARQRTNAQQAQQGLRVCAPPLPD